ncbi:hypothetical protein CTI14_02350 [Methylobacterium radiotolerans]|nr:hypothetical protein CTI14_02350 [Methylobacterium radiotolerans]
MPPRGRTSTSAWPCAPPSAPTDINPKNGKPGIGDKDHCHPTHLVWTDIDLKDHPEIMDGQTDVQNMPADELAEYKSELLRQVLEHCTRLNLPPRAIVDSGHGLQVYWARRARSTTDDTETYNRGLMQAFGGDEKSTTSPGSCASPVRRT